MNKHLNNWLDEQEGLPTESSNNAIKREMERQGVVDYAINDAGLSEDEAERMLEDF